MRSLFKFLMIIAMVLMVPATFVGCGPAGDLSPSESQASPEEEQSDEEVEAESEMDDDESEAGEEEMEEED